MGLNSYQRRIVQTMTANHERRTWEHATQKAPWLTRVRGKKAVKMWQERMQEMKRSIQLKLNLYGKYMVQGEWDRFNGAQKEFFATLFTKMKRNFLPTTQAEREWNARILMVVRKMVGKPGSQ
ncbi:MAG: hypothetical protein FJY86_02930 [Candidatus Diapherotrites archaeon]|uniref:Uncharacterized protein n=1 Tax=Candidatus Iainarchaeum sp. TaxID=3101447 RepID=A0A8T4CBE1_9ARCH|nr:hypothetical protein [Candidatus Diapherotrites archaeon]